jgi:hypothetical protein
VARFLDDSDLIPKPMMASAQRLRTSIGADLRTLANGAITAADMITVELHHPADLLGFVLIKWPDAPSVTTVQLLGGGTNPGGAPA